MSVEVPVRAAGEHPLVSLDRVSFAYGADSPTVLDSVEWTIADGTFALLVGESGSGKSTLLRCLNGLVPHFSGGRFGGTVTVARMDTRRHRTSELSRAVGFVFQDPDAQRVCAIVEDEIAFGMEQQGVPRDAMRLRVEEVLDVAGIAALRRREVATLSGGERQRVAIAAALALQPRLLALDEPTSQLDPAGADEVLAALSRFNEDLGLTVVMSEHRLERVLGMADELRALTPTGLISGAPGAIVQQLDIEMLPPLVRLARMLGGDGPVPLTVKEGRAWVRANGLQPEPPAAGCDGSPGPAVLAISGLTCAYGERVVIRDVSLEACEGETVALMGRNGSGKTTLLRAIAGFHKPERGRIELRDASTSARTRAGARPGAGYLPQRPAAILFHETPIDELRFTLEHNPTSSVNPHELLAQLDLAHLAGRDPRDLSTGEQERAALAAVLAADPAVLLLDEPTRGMDSGRKRRLAQLLHSRRRRGMTTILATHDVELAAEAATRVVMLGDGEIVADGPPREMLTRSLGYSTQISKLFGEGFLTVEDVVRGLGCGEERVARRC